MKRGRDGGSGNGLFTMSRLGSETLTREALENYLAQGRRLHSAYVCGLCARLWRVLGAVFFQVVNRINRRKMKRRSLIHSSAQ